MDMNVKEYKKVSNCIGWGLCIFLAMINVTSIIRRLVSPILFEYMFYDAYYIVDAILFDIIGYLASFIVPAIIIRAILRGKGILQPIKQETGRLSATSLMLIPIGIWITKQAATVNTVIMEIFGTLDAYNELVGDAMGEYYFGYEIVLLFISMAIVPAVAEEFLFRATVLSNLKPYGKVIAIIGSSVLFGLMHQNPYQLIYTTVAGIVMGYAYLKTGSIWCPMLIHFFNNAYSVFQQVLLANANADVAMIIILILELLLTVAAAICLVFYIRKMIREKRAKYKDGSFGVLLEESYAYSSKPIGKGKIKGFLSVGMIFFIVLSLALAGMLLVTLMTMGGGVA